jgi:hypothetical protein
MSTFADIHKDFCEHVLLKNRCHECIARKECEHLAQVIEKDYWPQLRKMLAGSTEVSKAKCCRHTAYVYSSNNTNAWLADGSVVPGFQRM